MDGDRMRNPDTHTFWEHSFRADLKLEELPLERRGLEFLYADGSQCYFVDPQTYDQVEIPKDMVGAQAGFLEAGMKLTVEFVEGRPVGVVLPGSRLENGVAVPAPQFVKTGDVIRLDLATLKYMDRARSKHVGSMNCCWDSIPGKPASATGIERAG